MQQRVRAAADAILRHLTMAGAGTDVGPDAGSLVGSFAPIVPRRVGLAGDPPAVARADAITITYVPATYVQGTTRETVSETSGLVMNDGPACQSGTEMCGVQAGMTIVVFDRSARHDVFTVTRVDSGMAELRPHAPFLAYEYPPGASVAQAVSRSFYFDRSASQLREYRRALHRRPGRRRRRRSGVRVLRRRSASGIAKATERRRELPLRYGRQSGTSAHARGRRRRHCSAAIDDAERWSVVRNGDDAIRCGPAPRPCGACGRPDSGGASGLSIRAARRF